MSVHVKLVSLSHQVLIANPLALFVLIIRTAIGVYSKMEAAPIRYPNASASDLRTISSLELSSIEVASCGVRDDNDVFVNDL